ncbi:YkyA family protein [Halobacillus salinus]|uniref:YkyA family protein n=1 Tax=Halobacillus salinus TaxID=192814 RepID=UPI0009A8552B|nr:YkyA family protein [Halobacillus salinus]
MRLRFLLALLAAAAFLLSACTGPSAQEEIYDHLEKAVTLEDAFREQQQPLVELENKEQELYNQIIELSMNEFDQIKKLSQEAAGLVEDRREKLELEKESIEAAKEEFDKIEPLIGDLEEDTEVKKKAEAMYEKMQERYEAYQELYNSYDEALTLDTELYEMMQKEDLKEEDLQKQIDSINQTYTKVIEANEKFNQYTEEYNDLKKEFYQASDLDVEYEEDSKEENSGDSESNES